jgi:CcmD family protein
MSTSETAPGQTLQTGRDSQFRAVQGGTEIASGSTLLVEAYAAIWIILLGFLLVGWRRQSRLEARMSDIEQAILRAQKAKEEPR